MKKLIATGLCALCAAAALTWSETLTALAGTEGLAGSERIVLADPAGGPVLPADADRSPNAAVIAPTGRVCLSFQTIDQGSYSGFGDYCETGLAQQAAELESVPFTPLGPCYAKVAMPAFEGVIRDECVWNDFWAAHTDNVFPPPPPPAVDFDKYAVIAVVSGTRPNGCYGMEIASVTSEKCGVVVRVREIVPCAGQGCTLALTNNYHFVKICKTLVPFETPLCFEHRFDGTPCSIGVLCATPLPSEQS